MELHTTAANKSHNRNPMAIAAIAAVRQTLPVLRSAELSRDRKTAHMINPASGIRKLAIAKRTSGFFFLNLVPCREGLLR
jgi:hypothetical protein